VFNSFYGETLKAYQNWVAGSFRSPAVPDRVRDYLLHLAVESQRANINHSGCTNATPCFARSSRMNC